MHGHLWQNMLGTFNVSLQQITDQSQLDTME